MKVAERVTLNTDELISICQRFEQLYVPAVADILDKRGLWNQLLAKEIMPLSIDHKVAGPAYTAKGHATAELDTGIGAKALEGLTPGSVAVWDTSSDLTTGHWGELMSTSAMGRGCRGAIVDGGIRDTGYIRGHGFPVWSRFRCAADAMGRWKITDVDIPVVISGVIIRPGDFVFADADGVVIIPKDIVMDVLVEAEEVVAAENKIRAALHTGESLDAMYGQFKLHSPSTGRS
jgi:regulator of RNase E activity RraA